MLLLGITVIGEYACSVLAAGTATTNTTMLRASTGKNLSLRVCAIARLRSIAEYKK